MVGSADTIRSPSIFNIFWNTPWVAGWVGPRFKVVMSFCRSLSSEKVVILISPIGVFQRKLLPHWKCDHVVHIQNPPQVRVSLENYPKKVICFPFHPVSPGEQICKGSNARIVQRQKGFNAKPPVKGHALQMIN